MEKKCKKCSEIKDVVNFSKTKRYKDGFHIYCKPCRVKLQRVVFLKNPETQRSYKRKWNKNLKNQVFEYYCDSKEFKCMKCGFSDIRALTLDHIEGQGNKHRKDVGYVYRWVVKNDFPEGFQILCMNCQFVKKYENKEN